MAKPGSRKPRKRTSSKSGASSVPKAVISQTSEGVRKNWSMGVDLGMVMREETAWTMKDTVMPMGMRRSALRPAAGAFTWRPAVKERRQRIGKINQGVGRGATEEAGLGGGG